MSSQLIDTLHTTSHDLTVISKKNRVIERKLERQLNSVVDLIRRIYGTTNVKTTGQIQQLLDIEVGEILRSSTQASYQLGISYVSTLLKHEQYMTTNDIYECDNMVLDYRRRFWGRVSRLVDSITNLQPQPNGSFSSITNLFVTSLSTDLTVKTLNLATRNRTKDLMGRRQFNLQYNRNFRQRILNPQLAEASMKDIEARLFEENPGLFPTFVPEQPFQVIKLVWVTSFDDRVCPECMDLEGQEWDINDLDIPNPGHESTHWNCRCRLMLAEREIN